MSELPILHLVPKAGVKIPVPGKRRALAEDGERVRVDGYWQRRISEGDVTIRAASEPAQPTKAAPKAQEG